MKKIFAFFMTIILTFVVLTGCSNNEKNGSSTLNGKYYYEDEAGTIYAEQYIEFSPDGNPDTMTLSNKNGEGPLLNYTINGKEITITYTSFNGTENETYSFSQQGNTIYFNGMKFVKQ